MGDRRRILLLRLQQFSDRHLAYSGQCLTYWKVSCGRDDKGRWSFGVKHRQWSGRKARSVSPDVLSCRSDRPMTIPMIVRALGSKPFSIGHCSVHVGAIGSASSHLASSKVSLIRPKCALMVESIGGADGARIKRWGLRVVEVAPARHGVNPTLRRHRDP